MPVVDSAFVSGNQLRINFDTGVTGHDGFTLAVNGSPASISWVDGEYPSAMLLFAVSPAPAFGDTLSLDYTPGDVQDHAGAPLAAFTGVAAANQN